MTSTPAISVSSISQPASATNIPQFFIPWYTAQQSTNSNPQSNAQGSTQSATPAVVINSNGASATNYTDYNCKTPDQTNSFCIECYSFFFFNTTQGKCAPVNPLCRNYTSQNQCTQCYSGYQLNNGNCTLSPAPTATQQSSNGQNSQGQNQQGPSNSDNNCANFTNGVCSQCFQSYYYNTTLNKCMQLNPNCKTATPNNICTSCYTGYKINPNNGDCILQSIDVPSASTATSSSSTAATTTTQPNSQPATNSNQYVTINGLIYQISPQGQVTGPIYLPSNTASNFPPTSSTTTQINTDPNCASYSNGQCSSCANRYYLTSSGCKMVDQYCQSSNTNGACTQCQNGYGVVNGGCLPVVYSNPTSFIAAANSPSTPSVSPATSTAQSTQPQCYTRQVLIGNACVDVSPYCSTWSNLDAKCTGCYTGYRLSSGSCIIG